LFNGEVGVGNRLSQSADSILSTFHIATRDHDIVSLPAK
jgi:hypothetical protein